MQKKLSVAIPTWESYGRGSEFLDDLLSTIEIQHFKNFEVVISDHSQNDDKTFCGGKGKRGIYI